MPLIYKIVLLFFGIPFVLFVVVVIQYFRKRAKEPKSNIDITN